MKNIIFIILFLTTNFCFPQDSVKNNEIKNTIITVKTDTINRILSDNKAGGNTKHNNDNNFDYKTHLVTLIVGVLIGLSSRHTEFKKYLLQKRIDIFSDFLSTAEPCRRDAVTSIFAAQFDKKKFNEQKIPELISTIYWPLILKQFHSSLILEEKQKKNLKNILKI